MKKFAKSVCTVLALVLIVGIFAGCTKNNTTLNTTSKETSGESSAVATTEDTNYPENGLPKDQNVTLKVGYWEAGNGREWYDACVESFTQRFPNVKIDTTYSPTITEVVKTKLAANDDEDMFDTFYYAWQELATAEKAEPLEDLLDRSPYDAPGQKLKDMYLPGICEGLSYFSDKHLYYLPLTTYMGGLFFDQKLFDDNGWNKSPKTWSEFLELCEAIKAKGIIPITTSGLYGYELFAFTPKQFELAEMNGNKDYITNYRTYRTPFYSTPENIERWARESELGKKGFIDNASVSLNHTQSQMLAVQHKAAMVVSGDWVENEMKESTPEGFKWGFMAVPYVDDPSKTVYIANGINFHMVVYKNKPDLNKKWAKEFLLSLTTLESQQSIVEKGGALSIRKDYGADPARLEKLKSGQKSVFEYINNHKTAFVDVYGFSIVLTHPSFAKQAKLYNDNTALMAVGKKDPTPILQEADKILKEAVDAYDKEAK